MRIVKQRLKEMEDETNKLMNGGDEAGAAEAAVDRKPARALHKMPRRLRCLFMGVVTTRQLRALAKFHPST